MTGVEDCFYHEAICQRTSKEKKPAPMISQIPGWGIQVPEGSESPAAKGKRMGLYEHDSPYVRLAKMGGRANLLSHPEAPTTKKEPVPYSKPDWMVYDTFTPSSPAIKVPVIPDYMIHDRPLTKVLQAGSKPPWAEDGQSVFCRDGEDVVRGYRTHKIEEAVKPGQRRLKNMDFNNNNDNNNNNNNYNGYGASLSPLWAPKRRSAKVRVGELETDFRSSRRDRETTAALTAAAAERAAAERASAGSPIGEMYMPSSNAPIRTNEGMED